MTTAATLPPCITLLPIHSLSRTPAPPSPHSNQPRTKAVLLAPLWSPQPKVNLWNWYQSVSPSGIMLPPYFHPTLMTMTLHLVLKPLLWPWKTLVNLHKTFTEEKKNYTEKKKTTVATKYIKLCMTTRFFLQDYKDHRWYTSFFFLKEGKENRKNYCTRVLPCCIEPRVRNPMYKEIAAL